MNRESLLTGGAVGVITLGLAVLLYGEAMHMDVLVPAGGIVALVGVGVLTGFVARL